MDDPTVTEADVAELNRTALGRSGRVATIVGTAVAGVGAAGIPAWAWTVYRLLDARARFSATSEYLGPSEPSAFNRLDVIASSFGLLLTAALVLGAGVGLRSYGEHLQHRAGRSLSGVLVGDLLPDPKVGPGETGRSQL